MGLEARTRHWAVGAVLLSACEATTSGQAPASEAVGSGSVLPGPAMLSANSGILTQGASSGMPSGSIQVIPPAMVSASSPGVPPALESASASSAAPFVPPADLCGCIAEAARESPFTRGCYFEPPPVPCVTGEDCCPASIPDEYACNVDFPFLYSCTGGVCATRTCTADADCQVRFEQERERAGYESYRCAPAEDEHGCLGAVDCQYYAKPPSDCQTASDCCQDVFEGFTCGADWPYIFECVSGKCEVAPCTASSQCDAQFEDAGGIANSRVNVGCVAQSDPCTGKNTSYCTTSTVGGGIGDACSTAADCCKNSISSFACNLEYPRLFDCTNGVCVLTTCSNDSQCEKSFRDYEGQGYINHGCTQIP